MKRAKCRPKNYQNANSCSCLGNYLCGNDNFTDTNKKSACFFTGMRSRFGFDEATGSETREMPPKKLPKCKQLFLLRQLSLR
ncbi:hypothetical protein CHX27_10585 [Flavobacterium aurantiibacter]|uniref:Uncharacterized protein n=1 Tax=Flavobacterium aurantiibacter TaxID=2023067 RepID=A0A255ZNT9_9FLAO|nr:hypothetical protein CHX27_10585 [Flavobacterium aurantiibacter]